MSEPGPTSMLRRLAQRAVAGGGQRAKAADAGAESRAELRDKIERKRRNDLVRKRELDMLRRVRHEGLTPEQAAALDAPTSVPGELEPLPAPLHADRMRARIDEIEQAMVGPTGGGEPRRAPLLTRPARLDAPSTVHAYAEAAPTELNEPQPATPAPPLPAAEPLLDATPESSDMAHDPLLDAAVMAFAHGDTAACEAELRALVDGRCAQDSDTWLVLADLYRATGQQGPFESLALAFSRAFNRSPPQWYSLPELAAADLAARGHVTVMPDAPVWRAPAHMDDAAIHALRAHCTPPSPWVLDWSAVRSWTPAGAEALVALTQHWAAGQETLHWRGVVPLLASLAQVTPSGHRDAAPVLWLARLAVLRLAGRSQEFESVAIDYCVTYEVSPPSWERVRCHVHADSEQNEATTALLSEPPLSEEGTAAPQPDDLVLPMVGPWTGDTSQTLADWSRAIDEAAHARIVLDAALLTRIDFAAAGDILNWIVARREAGRHVRFVDLHRLTALMLSVMGLNEHVPLFLRRT